MYSITITLKAIAITFVLKHSQKDNKTHLRKYNLMQQTI